jgi:TolA-binding protein
MPTSASTLDQFSSSLRGFFDSAANHSRAVLVGVAVLLGAGVGLGYYLNVRTAKNDTANAALFLARQSVEKELTAIAAVEAPKPPAPKAVKKGETAPTPPAPSADLIAYKKLDVDGRLADGVKKLEAVSKTYGGTRAAFEARLTLGDLFYNHGHAEKAVRWYREAVDGAPGAFERSLAMYSLGYSLENSSQSDEAIKTYEKAISLGESVLKGDLMLALARTYEAKKDTAKAKATYDQILSQLPNTEFAKSAETFKAQLGN